MRLPGLPPPAFRPLYTFTELVRYADATPRTARRWLSGYEYPTRFGTGASPAIAGAGEVADLRTFADLVEVAAISAARSAHVPLQSLRRAVSAARGIYGWERPLLAQRFRHDGREFFITDPTSAQPVNLSRWGQIAWRYIADVLRDLDYEQEIAARWWPLGHSGGISVDPAVSFGRPVVDPFGVTTLVISERFKAGDSIADLADDYSIPPDLIETAVRYEQQPRVDA
jgi:uncharacterized protein (DUF433 family)